MPEAGLQFQAARGLRLAGVLSLPAGARTGTPAPGVVLCQGLSGVKHLVLPEIAERLAGEGIASIRFDYAGYGESQGEPGFIDPAARIEDALSAFTCLAGDEAVDPARIGAYGHSYGGPVAISLAARQPAVRAVVSVSGPGDGTEMLRSLRPSWEWIEFKRQVDDARQRLASTGEDTLVELTDILPLSPKFRAAYEQLKTSGGGTSAIAAGDGVGTTRFWLSSVDAMRALRPQDAVRGLRRCPLLMVHGEDDDVALIEGVRAVYANAPGPKRLVVMDGMAHNDLDAGPGLGAAADLAANWFAEHL